MSNVDTAVLLQGLATIAWGTAGIHLHHRSGVNAVATDRMLGCGLLVGATLLGLDTMTAGTAAMPLSSWALLACSAFALLPDRDSALRVIGSCAWRRTLAAIGAFLLLHWLHHAAPSQPILAWNTGLGGAGLRPLDLLAASALGWLALRRETRPQHESSTLPMAQQRLLFGATAAGLLLATFGGSAASELTAAGQLVAVAPMLWYAVQAGDRRVMTAMATAMAAVTALGLRACTTDIASLGDPLLAIAAMFIAFGIAASGLFAPRAIRDQRHEPASPPATPAPAPANTTSTASGAAVAATPNPLSMRTLGNELRAPLTSILAAAELLGEAGSKRDRADHLATIHDQGRQLAATLSDLEDFERVLCGELEIIQDTLGLADLLHGAVHEAQPRASARGIEVRIDLAAGLPRWVQGDPMRIRQLIDRLLALAVQRSAIGHVDLAATHDAAGTHILVQNTAAATHLAMSEVDDKAGDTFRQGIGTTFARQLALAMGGDLQVTQRNDGGVLFHLSLPLATAPEWEADIAEADAVQGSSPTPKTSAVSGHCLLVDDSRDHQRLLGYLLTRAGAQVTTAGNGEIALYLLQEQSFDLILMDLQMPEMDGLAATRELRKRGITTPVLALTADSGAEAAASCLAAGCNGHLAKPVQREVLQRMLAMYLPAAAVN